MAERCGRVSIVTIREEIVLDTFSHYPEEFCAYPSAQWRKLGVKWQDIKPWNGPRPIDQITQDVTRILDLAGTVVGHAIANDMHMLRDVPWEKYQIRDTQ